MTKDDFIPAGTRKRWMARGESLIALAGLSCAVIIVLVVAGMTVWIDLGSEKEAARAASENNARHSTAAAAAAEAMLASGDVSLMRQFVTRVGSEPGVVSCRVELPDGRVIADSDGAGGQLIDLPETWEGAATPDSMVVGEGGWAGMTIVRGIDAGARGKAAWRIEYAPAGTASGSLMIRTGAALCGAVGLGLLLALYRRFRSRVSAISAIRDSLLEMGAGETCVEALIVDPEGGAEAVAWNALLAGRGDIEGDADANGQSAGGAGRARLAADALGVCDMLTQGIVLIDADMHISYANGAAGILLQTTPGELIGNRPSGMLGAEEVVETIRGSIGSRSRGRTSVEVSAEGDGVEDMGGTLRVSVRSIRDREDAAVLVVVEDITQQKMAERSRQAFVAQATHELRTPLTNVRLYVEQALDEGENDPQIRAKALNVINQEARRLERIVGDMLSVSEIEAGSLNLRIDDVRLDQFFEEISADHEAGALEKSIGLRFETPPKLPVIKADRDKLGLALHNLVGNAIKYTPSGGSVVVKIEAGTDDSLSVQVTDSGMGIAPEEHEKVFERFYRSADQRVGKITGSGIGLALARDVIRLHGGDITLDSEIDKGSTFTLTLPGREAGSKAA